MNKNKVKQQIAPQATKAEMPPLRFDQGFVAFSSEKNITKVTPMEDVILVTIQYGDSREIETVEQSGIRKWKNHVCIDMKVLDCHLEFSPTDMQAKRIGEQIVELIEGMKKEDVRIIIQCQHGEIRSRTVARAVAWELDIDLFEIQPNGSIGSDSGGGTGTFEGRTHGGISRVLRQHFDSIKEQQSV